MEKINLQHVDWSLLPQPIDDGAADHLAGCIVPSTKLMSTDGNPVDIGSLTGWNVLYFYPLTGRPDMNLPEGWDDIPGARGCTPQSCSFRDHYGDLRHHDVAGVFGVSTQSTEYQKEAAERMHLPFPLLSDDGVTLEKTLRLPTMVVGDRVLYKRITLILRGNKIKKVFYPIFPPDRNAGDVLNYMKTIES